MSRRELSIIMVIYGFIFKISKLRSLPVFPSYPKHVWNYLNKDFFTVFNLCINP